MHQCDGGPTGKYCGGGHEGPGKSTPDEQTYWHSWGHVTSSDGARWRRVHDALQPTVNGIDSDHGADCDGTVSFPEGLPAGAVITYGPGCGFHCANRSQPFCGPPDVGLALAANASDPQMIRWEVVRPMQFEPGSKPCDYANPPGRIWKAASGTHWNMLCGAGNETAKDPFGRGSRGPWAR